MSQQAPKTIIKDRWRLDGIIGQGGFGSVYIATDLKTNEIVAAKLQRLPANPSPSQIDDLEHESNCYALFSNRPGVATLHDNGRTDDFEFMVCELLGASLQSLFYHCERKFSLKTTLMLADQLIQRLEVFHSRNLLHRDVKPDNFAMGFGKENGKTVYILDFGLVGDFVHDEGCATAPSYAFCGSYYWASIATHLDRSQSPKDDLESLAYMLIYFARGSLPWQGAADDNEATNRMSDRITRLKLSLPIDLICKDLPSEFGRHLKYVRSLKYNDKPNYMKLREMYQRLMKRLGHEYDGVYDWDLKERNSNAQKDENPLEDMKPASTHGNPPSKENEQEHKDKQQPNKEPIAKAAAKRKIVFVKKADDESHPPKRQRRKPAEAEKKVAKPKKVAAKKAPAKKQVARKKAC
ncbi:casein kinase i isoform delta [Trichoderma arundinaceum]|uniref:Casein kinase i isoform delta n=1 Tax=Trichoderma arundinaceum TaxID=490622 RepID=A0A395NEC2_TRIAR|nr:casein kinase i isoform delta [Trichoderma arundinaceum]